MSELGSLLDKGDNMIKLNIRRFASGTINLSVEHPSSSVTFQGKLDWSSTPNSSNNTSSVTVKLSARKQGSNQATSGTFKGKIGIAGTNHSFSQSKSVGNSWVLIATATQTVQHNNDGTKSITISGEVGKVSGTTLADINSTGQSTVALDTIQKASTLNSVTFNITTVNGTTTGTVTANFNKYNSNYYDTLQVTKYKGNFSESFMLSFAGVTSGTPKSLNSSQLETIFKDYCNDDVSCSIDCRLLTKTGPSGTNVGYSKIIPSTVSLPDYEINIDNFTVADNIDTYDNFKPGTDKNKTLIANLSSPTFTFSASSSTGDTYYYPIVYTLDTMYNPDPEHPDWYSGDIYNNITSPYVLNPIAINSEMPFSLHVNQGGYRYEKGDSTTIDDITVIDYQYPYAYCTFTRPTPTSTTINISGSISWYDGTGLQNLGTKSTTITYRINGVEQTKTIASSEYGTITTDGAHMSRCSFTTTITIGAADYKYPISYSIQMTDLLGVASSGFSGQIPAGECLWYGYMDNNQDQHMVVNGELIGKGNIKGKTIEYGDVKDNLLPNGDLLSGSYWCSIPNGHYWIGTSGSYTNSPVSWGFVDKTGFYTKDGTVADYNVIIYSAADGPIYRLYNNNNSTNTWRRVDGGATMMTLSLSSDQAVNQTGAVKIKVSSSTVTGTGLSLSSNGIKIGSGIKYVEVSGAMQFKAYSGADLRRAMVYKNSTNVAQGNVRPTGTYESAIIAPKLISVAENDVIYLYLNSDSNSQTIYGSTAATYLTVKVVR